MANFKKNDEAVSAVIGVILMVAITVILAAVIAAFVFQLGGNVPKTKSVGVDVKRLGPDSFVVKTMSGADVTLLATTDTTVTPAIYTYSATGTSGSTELTLTGSDSTVVPPTQIGGSTTFSDTTNHVPSGSEITIVATFTDGTTYAVWSGNLA